MRATSPATGEARWGMASSDCNRGGKIMLQLARHAAGEAEKKWLIKKDDECNCVIGRTCVTRGKDNDSAAWVI